MCPQQGYLPANPNSTNSRLPEEILEEFLEDFAGSR